MSDESETPCIFKFKVAEGEMKWAKMHSWQIKISVKLLSKTKGPDC